MHHLLFFSCRTTTLLALFGLAFWILPVRAGERVGIYDSRVVAYACFWEPGKQAARSGLINEGRAAKDRGDTARFREIEEQIKAEQETLHLQVFSTAPCPDALALLADRVAKVRRDRGLDRLVSQWDKTALREIPAADRIDVTDALVRELPLAEKQRAVMRQIAAKEPLPLWKARVLVAIGKL